MDKTLWINKYKPLTSNEIIGHQSAIQSIKTWLKTYSGQSANKANVFIIGPHGVGKTTIVEILLKEAGYKPNHLNINKIDDLNEYIISLVKCNDIFNLMNENVKIKNAIIVDDMTSISSTNDKKTLDILRKINDDHRYMPIIFISNTQHSKFISKFQKLCQIIYFNAPKKNECYQLLEKIMDSEKIKINDNSIKNKIIEHTQGDIRRLINVVQDIYSSIRTINHDNKYVQITVNDFNQYIQFSNKKEINIGLFNSARQLFDNYNNIDDSILLYETEKNKLPLMVHEHYFKHVINRFKKKENKLKVLRELKIGRAHV